MPITMIIALFKERKILNALFVSSMSIHSLIIFLLLTVYGHFMIVLIQLSATIVIYAAYMSRAKTRVSNPEVMNRVSVENLASEISLKDKFISRRVGVFEMIKVIWHHSEALARVP